MRVLVCGSRTFNDRKLVDEVLTGIYQVHAVGWQVADLDPFIVVHGGAPGADTLAKQWAKGCPLHGPHIEAMPSKDDDLWEFLHTPVLLDPYPADWGGPCDPEFCQPGHRRTRNDWRGEYCPAAGPRRNRRMLEEGKPDRFVAFVDKPLPESRGTADMVQLCEKAGVPGIVVRG